uniref:Uncharacterized protein n=1 Tax=Amphimedon queenslandica TaxID=400682 RepID=A0A1X7V2T6_AMPQE
MHVYYSLRQLHKGYYHKLLCHGVLSCLVVVLSGLMAPHLS